MGLIFFQALLSLLGRLISDLTYMVIDPRIDFQ
jgi:ABC-type microcin C transport system permease subunit YejB